MSVKALSLAWEMELSASHKLTLLALADYADDEMSCFPSVATLAQKTCQNPRTVQRHITEFEKQGLLKKERRNRDSGADSSNRYVLILGGDTTPPSPGTAPPSPGTRPPQGVAQDHPNVNRHKEPSLNTTLLTRTELDKFENEIREAAGLVQDPSPNFMDLSQPLRWLENGFDLERDIIPTLKAVSQRKKSFGGWGYFSQAIADAHATRTAPLNGNAQEAGNGRKQTRDEQTRAFNEAADEYLKRLKSRQNAGPRKY